MGVSGSGLGTLLALIFVGPVIYGARYLYNEFVTHSHGKSNVEKSEVDGKENLSGRAYLFALVGYAIGIGNVWRFPYVIANNGGSAALFAYMICAIFVAWPLFIYELILGQHTRLTFMTTWEYIHPRWLSFGWAQFLLLFIAQSYFSVIIMYTLPYIAGSCQDPLPWTDGTDAQTYWTRDILNSFDSLDEKGPGPGPIQPTLAISLVVFWLITFFSVAFGKNILSQITYVTVTLPVILMVILVIVSTQQPGAREGIDFYIGKFEWSELGDLSVWATALSQILFSLSPGFGTAITYSSFVGRKEDVYRTGLIVALCNSAFSILAGFSIFSIVGYLAHQDGVSVEEVATRSGTGLAFITIAEAMTLFGDGANAMSVLFYVMLLTLGLDSSYAWTETLVSSMDEFLQGRGYKVQTWRITLGLSVIMFLFGLVFTTRMGNEILDVIDMFVGTLFLLFVCFVEAVILNWNFGWRRLNLALRAATFGGKRFPRGRNIFPRPFCRVDFHVTVPLATIFLFLYRLQAVSRDPYGDYPRSLLAWGWTLLAICLATTLLTIWKCGASTMPAIEEDPRFDEVLGKASNDEVEENVEVEIEDNGKDPEDVDPDQDVGVQEKSEEADPPECAKVY